LDSSYCCTASSRSMRTNSSLANHRPSASTYLFRVLADLLSVFLVVRDGGSAPEL
jgi:hypothetical protein